MSTPLLEVKDLHTSFNVPSGEVRSVNGVSFTLNKNEILGIVGESGSGKSVTAYSIMQILEKPGRVVGGSIKFKGQEMLNIPHKQIQRIRGEKVAIIFQDSMTSLNPVWSIGNQLRECLKAHPNTPGYKALRDKVAKLKEKFKETKDPEILAQYKIAKKEYRNYPRNRSLEMLRLVGINEPEKRLKQYPFEFSGGMLQRVMIAMSLICEPDLIIADEPTTALDVTIQAQILELLISLQKKIGMGIIIITHDLGVVAQVCDKVNVMYAGRVVETGTVEDIFYNPQHEYTKGLINSIPKLNTKNGEKLHPIPGNPVDVFRLPTGCSFVPRCEKCMKVCLKKYPAFINVDEHHKTSCFAYIKDKLDKGEMSEEEFAKYLESSKEGNSSYRKITLLDVEHAKDKLHEAKENLSKADFELLTKDEIEVLKYRVSECKTEVGRASTDFKAYIKSFSQSSSERKSIDKNDCSKKVAHSIKEMKQLAPELSQEGFDEYINKLVVCTSAVKEGLTPEDVMNAKKAFKEAKAAYFANLFKNNVEVKNNYYQSKIKYVTTKNDYEWKCYVDKRKESCIKRLTAIYKKVSKGAN